MLIARFQLSDLQAEAILETKLRHLARLEEMRLRGEQGELHKEQEQSRQLLASEKRLNMLIRKEIQDDAVLPIPGAANWQSGDRHRRWMKPV